MRQHEAGGRAGGNPFGGGGQQFTFSFGGGGGGGGQQRGRQRDPFEMFNTMFGDEAGSPVGGGFGV